MIAATHIGLIAHNIESIYERIINNQIVVSPALIQIIRLVQDDIADRIQTIREEGVDYAAPESIAILNNIVSLAQGEAGETAAIVPATAQAQVTSLEVEAEAETAAETNVQPIVEATPEILEEVSAELAVDAPTTGF